MLRVVCQGNIVPYSRCPFLCVDWNIVPFFYVEAFVFRSCVFPLVNFALLVCGWPSVVGFSVSPLPCGSVPLLSSFLRKRLWGCNIRHCHSFTLLVAVALSSPFYWNFSSMSTFALESSVHFGQKKRKSMHFLLATDTFFRINHVYNKTKWVGDSARSAAMDNGISRKSI